MKALDVGIDQVTFGRMNYIHHFRQMQLDTAPLAERCTRRTARGSFDAMATDLQADFRHVIV
jgi:hypothetical protein